MVTTVKTGNYYKLKTKKYLQNKGYYVEYMEKMQRIYTKGRVIFIKRDLLGADGLAVSNEEFILWQSKLGKSHIAEAIRQFKQYPCPEFIDRWIIVWTKRQLNPEIIPVE
ncbi:hypothetical protein KAW50_03620 [candidate division WOR-3 bacterium]|nr:hypothetical protein [candidate division WOR-3 bacterium]